LSNRFDKGLGFEDSRLTRWGPLDELSGLVLDPKWREILKRFWRSEDGLRLSHFLESRLQSGAHIYPASPFKALELTPFDQVNIVILGQDPYHGEGQAHGLAFSVPQGIKPPPSLVNIFKELKRDPGIDGFEVPTSGNLQPWAQGGVLLLNSTLTVEQGQPASHAGQGWEVLTDLLVSKLAQEQRPLVFMLWGTHAQSKAQAIKCSSGFDPSLRLILTSNHPSPLSALRGKTPFIGNCHFSSARDWLAIKGTKHNWRL